MIGDFVEVYVHCPVDVCAQRDVKGLYAKAMAGEIPGFTGVSDPYEEPLNPEVVVDSSKETVEQSARKILLKLEEMGYVPPAGADVYSDEEEEEVKRRLEELGYF